MQITIAVSLLVAICYAADAKNKDKPAPSKTDKRDLLEGNYGERTYLKNVLRSAQGIDYSNQEDTLSGRSSHGYSSTPRISKISDVLSSEGPHYSAISDHLFSPLSAYQSRLSSPTFDQNTELGLSEIEPKPKSSKKHKKPKSPPKRTYPSYDPRPLQFDTLSSFANYQPELSQFKNLYQEPTFDKGVFSPRIFAEPSIFRPIRPVAPQFYSQAFQHPQIYPQQAVPIQREYQPIQYIQQPVQPVLPRFSYAERAQQVIPGLAYSQVPQQALPRLTYPQFQQAIPSPAFAQPTQQVPPRVIYANGAQQIIPGFNPNIPQVVPAASYAQGAQQLLPGPGYPQVVQQVVPNVAYAQGPQEAGVIYAQQPEPSTIQQQQSSVSQQQTAPQQPQQIQGAVSYASFSQSLPPYNQPQVQSQPQEQASLTQQAQTQTYLLPARPDLSGAAQQQQTPVPDSQSQPQQISESHPTSQPDEDQVATILPAKSKVNDQIGQAENFQSDSSNVEPTTQPAPQEIAHSQTTQAPFRVSTLPNLVPSHYQQLLQEVRPQPVEKDLTYLQGQQAYPENVVYQQPGLVNGGVAPTFPSVQYFGNFAESLFRNYQ